MRILLTFALVLALAAIALAADSPAPNEFGDVPLGAPLQELKTRYPDASRNPDSDRHFQVYQVPTLHGASVKSPSAFQIYQGHVVGGQVLLDSHNAQHWFDATVARYGKPDSCTYCDDPESTTAVWHWENGTSLKIEGEMLTELTIRALPNARHGWRVAKTTNLRITATRRQMKEGSRRRRPRLRTSISARLHDMEAPQRRPRRIKIDRPHGGATTRT